MERMSQVVRWVIAAAAVTALVYALVPSLPAPSELVGAKSAASDVCPADAKAANLDFTVNDMHGKTVALSSFKGKVIVLDFWATWCPPCKAEIPGFVELQDAYGDKGLQVVGVSVDDPADKLPPFATEFKMNYPVLVGLGRDDLQDAYGPMWGIPTTFVINRDGKICRKHSGLVGKERYEKDIKALL
jgi:peroxiredoxin